MDSFKDVLEAAQSYCKAQMAEPTYNLYIDGLEPISFEDSSHITLSVRITLVVPSTPPHEVVLAQQYEANPASPQGNYEFTFENSSKAPPTSLRLLRRRLLRPTPPVLTTHCSSTAARASARPIC